MYSSKSELTCNICKLVLSTPVTLPCLHMFCGEHLRDGTVKDRMIKCLECGENFGVPRSGFPLNERVVDILAKEDYLSDEEKEIKSVIQELIHKLEHLQYDVKLKQKDMEVTSFDHFTEIRRQIDIQREELKKKIDEISLKLIDQANEREKAYTLKLNQSISVVADADIKQFSQILMREFREPNLLVDKVKRLQTEHEQNVKEFEASIREFDSLGQEIKSLEFETRQEFHEAEFGNFRLKDSLIAGALGNNIKIWNIYSSECVATLEGHSSNVNCLECIDKNRFASGSLDKTIRIWDSKHFACLKIVFTDHQDGVMSLKRLPLNRLASGSVGDFKIWNLESGECLQTLNALPMLRIKDFVCLSNENLVSISDDDETIKVWDLASGECIKTLRGHSDVVYCIFLLRNDKLASVSVDLIIKIWNTESGECINTLEIEDRWINHFQELESGEFVSYSSDTSIKILNITGGILIQTLVGHKSSVNTIRVNCRNNTLVSSSEDGTIKTWNLKTGVCVNTIFVHRPSRLLSPLEDFICI